MYTLEITISNPIDDYKNPDELYTIEGIHFKYMSTGRIQKLRGVLQSADPITKDIQDRVRAYFKDFGKKVELTYKQDPAAVKAARQSRKANRGNNAMNGSRSAKKSVKKGAKSVVMRQSRKVRYMNLSRKATAARQSKFYPKRFLPLSISKRKTARKSAKKSAKSMSRGDLIMNILPNYEQVVERRVEVPVEAVASVEAPVGAPVGAPSIRVRRTPQHFKNMARRSRKSRQERYSRKRFASLLPIVESNNEL